MFKQITFQNRINPKILIFSIYFLNLQIKLLLANEYSHKYKTDDHVLLWANTVGPYHNRQETYDYFSLPFCKGNFNKGHPNRHHDNIGDALQGVELTNSGLEFKFKFNMDKQVYCSININEQNYKKFTYAIDNHYWYQLYMDDLPIWGIVGELNNHKNEKTEKEYYIYTHKTFEIGYNNDQIVEITLLAEDKQQLKLDKELSFSYDVIWRQSTTTFANRYEKYLDHKFFQHRIHWFSIFNSFMMVIFLVGLVSMILMRTLKKDYARYSKDDDLDAMERDLGDEYGWKQVHGDVFRPAAHRQVFSAFIGSGMHLCCTAFTVLLLIIFFELYTEHGSIISYAIFCYAVLSPVNGFTGGQLYARMGGKMWIRQMVISALLVPSLVTVSAFLVNFIAIGYHASRAIPFTTMLAISAIWLFVVLPLTLIGSLFGRHTSSSMENVPCRVNHVPRPIPDVKCFMKPINIVLLGGILPFGSIFIEMYFIFTSFWAYKVYYVYGFTLLALIILLVVTICISIVCTYFLLNAEDYRWRWTSFATGFSTSGYIYLYSIYYFLFKTKMYGLFQTAFYFSYMALFSVCLGILCGAIGYLGTSIFVHKIYTYVKID